MKKLIAPIVITVFIVLYFMMYIGIVLMVEAPLWITALGLLIPILLSGVTIAMLMERIKEIRSGEEDDLSKY